MVKQHLAYTERNGGYFYFSPYLDNKVKNMVGVISPNPERWYKKRYTPHSDKYETKSEYIYLHRINSLGLRGPEPVAGKNVFRIMSLGDSFTEGAGAPEDSTWIHLLAEQFETRSLDAFTYLNGGVNGADPFLSYYIFKELMTRFSPQLVILLINSSDISDHMNKGGKERFDENARITYPKGPWWEPLYACSYIFRGIVHIVADMDYNFRSPAEQKEREAIARTAIKDFIVKDYKAIMTANNISFWVFCIPRQYELEMKTRVYPDFEQYLSEAGVQYEDLADDIEEYLKKKQISTDDIYWQNDMHFNAKGYQLISELMFKKISSDTAIFHPDNIVH